MPSMPSSQCDEYQCKAHSVKGSRYCEAHTPNKTTTIQRQAFNAKYKTSAWDSIRTRQLTTSPLCAACFIDGRITEASHVDHVFPWSAIGQHAFTRNLFQSLCSECHGVKSGIEKKGVFRHYTDKVRDFTVEDYAYVMTQQ